MKRVTFTYTMEFEDTVSDENCVESTIECMSQDRHYSDEQFKIETVPDEDTK